MPTFEYRARRAEPGVPPERAAQRPEGTSSKPAGELPWHQQSARGYFSFIFHRVKNKDLAIWYRQFSYLLHSGQNLYQAAGAVAEKTRNRTLRRIAAEISEAAGRGEEPIAVVRRWPCVFPRFARSLVAMSESVGTLDRIFGRLADFYDQAYTLELFWRVETLYAKILLTIAVVTPIGREVLSALLSQLPGGGLAAPLVRPILSLALLIVAAFLGWRALRSLPDFAELVDRIKLALPWFGPIVRRSAVARFARALSMLWEAGAPVTRALRESAGASGNAAVEHSLARHAGMLDAGKPLTAVLDASRVIPAQVIDMVATGEQAGNLAVMLEKAAEHFELEIDVAKKETVITLAILMLLIAATLVGIYVISRYMQWAAKTNSMPVP